MADFINTIDALGDDAVVDSIIDRSITEFKDDRISSVGAFAFYGCTKLTEVELPNATWLPVNMFLASNGGDVYCTSMTRLIAPNAKTDIWHSLRGLPNLRIIDFVGAAGFYGSILSDSTSLVACVLRNSTVISLNCSFKTMPYIYVPRALVDSYKVATNWSNYASQFRALEDYTVDGTVTGKFDETKI